MSRRWELAVLAFGGVFLIFLAISVRPGRRPARSTAHEALPGVAAEEAAGQPTTVSKGFDYTESVKGKPIFRIQSERTVAFGADPGLVPNVYLLENVTLTLYPEHGAAVTVRSDKAEYDQRTKRHASRETFAGSTIVARSAKRPAWSSTLQAEPWSRRKQFF
jgi:hypothetical protein